MKHLHTTNKKTEQYTVKSATRIFCEVWCKFWVRFVRSERVALFFTSGRATVQGHRVILLEYAHVVRFPGGCVGSEKIAKYVLSGRGECRKIAQFNTLQDDVRCFTATRASRPKQPRGPLGASMCPKLPESQPPPLPSPCSRPAVLMPNSAPRIPIAH